MQIVTPVGDTAYVWLVKAQPPMQEGKEPQFACTFVWPKTSTKLKKLEAAIKEVAKEKWGAKAEKMLASGQLRSPLRDGDDTDNDEYQGKYFLTARSTDKPEVVDRDAEPVMSQLDIYSGMQARGDVYLFAYDKAGNRGVGAILNSVQKTGDGERKSGRRSAADAFGALDDEDMNEDAAGGLI
jgi:hypothetical protein